MSDYDFWNGPHFLQATKKYAAEKSLDFMQAKERLIQKFIARRESELAKQGHHGSIPLGYSARSEGDEKALNREIDEYASEHGLNYAQAYKIVLKRRAHDEQLRILKAAMGSSEASYSAASASEDLSKKYSQERDEELREREAEQEEQNERIEKYMRERGVSYKRAYSEVMKEDEKKRVTKPAAPAREPMRVESEKQLSQNDARRAARIEALEKAIKTQEQLRVGIAEAREHVDELLARARKNCE